LHNSSSKYGAKSYRIGTDVQRQADIRVMRYIPDFQTFLLSILLIGFAQSASAQQKNTGNTQSKERTVPDTLVISDHTTDATSTIFRVAEQMPSFPGDLMSFLAANIRYPDSVTQKSPDGKVVIQFVVRKNGALTDFKFLRSAGKPFDNEVLRVIRLMPPWIPGKNKGIPVDVYYVLPVILEAQ
jgi:TonB family protein